MKISVVIPTYNRPVLFARTMYSFWRQHRMGIEFETLVSIDDDQAYIDKTLQVLHLYISKGMDIKYFLTGQYKKEKGWSVETYPLNVGIKRAAGDIIMINSGEVMSVTSTVDEHACRHRILKNKAIISTVWGLSDEGQKSIDNYDWKEDLGAILKDGKNIKLQYTGDRRQRPLHFQMSISRDVLHKMRGLDERYYGWYGGEANADVDFANRLTRMGLEFVFDSDIVAIHQWHPKYEYKGPRFNTRRGKIMTNENLNKSPIRNLDIEWGAYPR